MSLRNKSHKQTEWKRWKIKQFQQLRARAKRIKCSKNIFGDSTFVLRLCNISLQSFALEMNIHCSCCRTERFIPLTKSPFINFRFISCRLVETYRNVFSAPTPKSAFDNDATLITLLIAGWWVVTLVWRQTGYCDTTQRESLLIKYWIISDIM